MGGRGTGALEFAPVEGPEPDADEEIQIGELVELASKILGQRDDFATTLSPGNEERGLLEILSVGMSAGGARAKAVIAWNPETNEVRSGQVDAPPGFEHWLLKFDGVSGNRDKERFDDPEGYGATEYAYALMAQAAGIEMSRCRLFEEHGRRHFMTRRFDRPAGNAKLHMQSLAALRHFDFNDPRAYSYEQALQTIRLLGLPMAAIEEQFRRLAFNLIARNQDDHVKNIAFLMDRAGEWSLSPAFDMTYSLQPRRRVDRAPPDVGQRQARRLRDRRPAELRRERVDAAHAGARDPRRGRRRGRRMARLRGAGGHPGDRDRGDRRHPPAGSRKALAGGVRPGALRLFGADHVLADLARLVGDHQQLFVAG